ncbi:hypothetical protein HOY80DRAFT_985566 [Tuber brumale]|nr:hypothetical protein HOY80DRAFT_985566 [Tuber brumale]
MSPPSCFSGFLHLVLLMLLTTTAPRQARCPGEFSPPTHIQNPLFQLENSPPALHSRRSYMRYGVPVWAYPLVQLPALQPFSPLPKSKEVFQIV